MNAEWIGPVRAAVLFLAAVAGLEIPTLAAQVDSAPEQIAPVPPRTPPGRPMRPVRVAFVDSLKQPESVWYDSTRDRFYVTNIEGGSFDRDGRAFLTRLDGAGAVDSLRWIVGDSGSRLDAPKGMAMVGDTLWVTDIDVVRGFDVATGRLVRTVDLASLGAVFLNDLAPGPDGALYVTDTRIEPDELGVIRSAGPARIFRIGSDGVPGLALQDARLAKVNGIAWDETGRRFLLVPAGGDTIMAWQPGSVTVDPLGTGPGQYDGVVVADGEILVASKATGSIHRLRDRVLVRLIENLGDVADLGYDPKRNVLAVALTGQNRVELYRLGKPPERAASR